MLLPSSLILLSPQPPSALSYTTMLLCSLCSISLGSSLPRLCSWDVPFRGHQPLPSLPAPPPPAGTCISLSMEPSLPSPVSILFLFPKPLSVGLSLITVYLGHWWGPLACPLTLLHIFAFCSLSREGSMLPHARLHPVPPPPLPAPDRLEVPRK